MKESGTVHGMIALQLSLTIACRRCGHTKTVNLRDLARRGLGGRHIP